MVALNISLDEFMKTIPMGDFKSSVGNTLYGVNHRQTPLPIPMNKEVYGLTFFTRPALNLTTQNARADTKFIPLLTNQSAHYQRYVRCVLDPRLNYSNAGLFDCPLLDHDSAFIPMLSNLCTSLSGWQDPSLDTFTSSPGVYKEQYTIVDSIVNIYSQYDMTATFRNIVGDPVSLLFMTWMRYISNVYLGIMMPYTDMITGNEIDYQTRIYRLVLDSTKRKVIKYAHTGVSVPLNMNIGEAFNFESDKVYNQAFDSVQISFRCNGALYNEPIVIENFNDAVEIFCEDMSAERRATAMTQIDVTLLDYFNCRGYPRIDPDTLELQWYIRTAEYTRAISGFNRVSQELYGEPEVDPVSY